MAGGRPSGSGSVPALQGTLLVFIILKTSILVDWEVRVDVMPSSGAFVHLDFTKHCFFLLVDLLFGVLVSSDDDVDEAVVVDS